MSTAAGDRITAARLNPAAFQLQLGSNYTLTATNTDLTLSQVTSGYTGTSYTAPEGGMAGMALWTADFQLVTAGTITSCTVELTIDGSTISASPQAIWDPENIAAGARATLTQSWPFTLAAGSHSFGLKAAISSSSGTVRLNSKHTALSIWLHP